MKPIGFLLTLFTVLILGTTFTIDYEQVGAQGTFTIERISPMGDGTQSSNDSMDPSISGDGRYVVFETYVSLINLQAYQIAIHDRQTHQTTRVSVNSSGQDGNADSFNPMISSNGRFVSFSSSASNLVAGDTNDTADVFVRDQQTGQISRVSITSSIQQANGWSDDPTISSDGRFVSFWSAATNLVAGDTNGQYDVFVRDRLTNQTTRVSIGTSGQQGNGASEDSTVSSDGRFIAFRSSSSNLVTGDTNTSLDIFVHDRQTGQTRRVSINTDGSQGDAYSGSTVISPDGRFVVFDSFATNLVPADTNDQYDVFVHDLQSGQTKRASVASSGEQGSGLSADPDVSSTGRYIVFRNSAGLIPDDTNNVGDIFVHDRETQMTSRVSISSSNTQANQVSTSSSISADGRFIAFDSGASNLVLGDTNGVSDIFVASNPLYGSSISTLRMSISLVQIEHQILPVTLPEPTWTALPPEGTTDGNIVRVSVEVSNSGSVSGQFKVRLIESGNMVAETSMASDVAAGELQMVQLYWDTSGYAWNTNGTPNLGREIQVEVLDTNQQVLSTSRQFLRVRPKPVIFVHGIRSTACMWDDYKNWLKAAHPYWAGYAVGDGKKTELSYLGFPFMDMGLDSLSCDRPISLGPTNSLDENTEILRDYIRAVREKEDAWYIDIIAHSMGGLVSRNYVAQWMPVEDKPIIAHLIMLGTPNGGAPCANLGFGTALVIDSSILMPTVEELTTYSIARFNRITRNQQGTDRYVPFYLVAGNSSRIPCTVFPFGDGVVPYESATAISSDIEAIASVDAGHSELAGKAYFDIFVKNWLAVPPPSGGAMMAPAQSMPISAEISAQADPPPPQIIYGQQLTIARGATLNIPLPVPAASRLQIVLIAPPTVAASLFNPSGVVVDQYAANSAMAQLPFQGLSADNPTAGSWTLRLVNSGTASATILVSASVEGSALLLDLTLDTPDSQGRVQINAALTNGGAPVTGATVSATLSTINGTPEGTLTLLDDGLNGDGAAGDGVYGRLSAPLPVGVHTVSVTASGPGFTRSTGGQVEVVGFDLSLTATAAPDPVYPGTSLTYTLTLANSGPSHAGTVVVTDTLPAGVTFTAAESTWGDICSESAGVVTCTVGTVFAGTNGTIQISVIPPSLGGLTNQASLTSSAGDTNPANNTVTTNTTVSNAPPTSAPVLLEPIGAVATNDTTPLLAWQAATNATDYDIQIDTDPAFASPDQTLTTSNLNIEPAALAEGAYVWRARAANSAGDGPWSTPASFSVDTTAPAIPALTAPADALATVLPQPVFTWGAVTGAVRYEVQVDSVNPPLVTLYSGAALTFTPSAPPLPGTYYWRVWAVDSAGNLSGEGPVRAFTLVNADDRAPDANFFTTSSVPLSWGRIDGAPFYQIEVDNTPTFSSSLEFSFSVGGDQLSLTTAPLLNGVYWWRVRACSSPTVCGNWSEVQTFTVAS